MVVLHRIDSSYVSEKFEGQSGTYWKSGIKGTATQFSKWVREYIRSKTVKNSPVKTFRDYVQNANGYEELVMSFGRKDEKPLDIHVGVREGANSYIGLEYPVVNRRETKRYDIKNPMALSIDPIDKRLISVVFTGPNFSFSGVKKKDLSSIPGFDDALRVLSEPIVEAARILDTFDSENYKSRNLQDFEASPEVQELRDIYQDWDIDVDVSKLSTQNKVTYIFTHPSDNKYNFTVSVRDEGGGNYRIYAFYPDHEISIDNLNQRLGKEVDRLKNMDILDSYSNNNDRSLNVGSIRKDAPTPSDDSTIINDILSMPEMIKAKEKYSSWEMQRPKVVHNRDLVTVSFPFYDRLDPNNNFTIMATSTPRGDFKFYVLFRDRQISLNDLETKLKDRLSHESFDRVDELRTQKVSGDTSTRDYNKDLPLNMDDIVKRLNKAIDDPYIDRISNLDITRFDDKEVWELRLKTQHGEKSLVWETDITNPLFNNTVFVPNDYFNDLPTRKMTFNTPEFYDVVADAAAKFRRDFGVFKTKRSRIDPDTLDVLDPDYDLANWADQVLYKIEPEIERLQDKYNLVLNRVFDDSNGRDDSGKLVFSGSYVDPSFEDHLLELRINYDRGEKFLVWIRPNLMGGADTKASGQSDLSFFTKWVENNVASRTLRMDSNAYRKSIEKELLGLGGVAGAINGTIEIATSKIKPVVIDLKVTNNKVLVTAYRDNRVVASISIDAAPFSVKPKLMAKDILSRLSKVIKESFPSIDRQYPNLRKYVEGLFKDLESYGIKKVSEQNVLVGRTSYVMSLDPFGGITIKTPMGKMLKESLLIADPDDREDDLDKIKTLFQS